MMTETDKRAFEDTCKGWAVTSAGKDLGEYFWQAALEYATDEQEPVGFVCQDVSLAKMRVSLPEGSALYNHPPAAPAQPDVSELESEVVRLRSALICADVEINAYAKSVGIGLMTQSTVQQISAALSETVDA